MNIIHLWFSRIFNNRCPSSRKVQALTGFQPRSWYTSVMKKMTPINKDPMNTKNKKLETEGRVARRQRRNREALVHAACLVMGEKGIDAATMQEIAERADLATGTVYNYFKSKDDLAIAVLEEMMHDLALQIEKITGAFEDPAEVYAYGLRTVLETATTDVRWKQMLYRSEVISDALYRRMGPFATRDFQRAVEESRFPPADAALVWRLSAYAIVGISLAITSNEAPPNSLDDIVIRLLCMTGIGASDAADLAARPRPDLQGSRC